MSDAPPRLLIRSARSGAKHPAQRNPRFRGTETAGEHDLALEAALEPTFCAALAELLPRSRQGRDSISCARRKVRRELRVVAFHTRDELFGG